MRRTSDRSRIARRALDRRLHAWRDLGQAAVRPSGGWVRAIREAVGMTSGELASRMGIAESSLVRLEQSERACRIRMDSLRRAADALDCELVYALVPRQPLETVVTTRARDLARADLAAVDHTMLLEAQQVDDVDAGRLDEYAAALLEQPGLWRERR